MSSKIHFRWWFRFFICYVQVSHHGISHGKKNIKIISLGTKKGPFNINVNKQWTVWVKSDSTQHSPEAEHTIVLHTYRVIHYLQSFATVALCRAMECQTCLVAVNKDQVQQSTDEGNFLPCLLNKTSSISISNFPRAPSLPALTSSKEGTQKSSFLWTFWFLCHVLTDSRNIS